MHTHTYIYIYIYQLISVYTVDSYEPLNIPLSHLIILHYPSLSDITPPTRSWCLKRRDNIKAVHRPRTGPDTSRGQRPHPHPER